MSNGDIYVAIRQHHDGRLIKDLNSIQLSNGKPPPLNKGEKYYFARGRIKTPVPINNNLKLNKSIKVTI